MEQANSPRICIHFSFILPNVLKWDTQCRVEQTTRWKTLIVRKLTRHLIELFLNFMTKLYINYFDPNEAS